MKSVVGIIQARMGSRRFPGKMLAKLGKHTLLEWVLARVTQSTHIDQVILAIPDTPEDQSLIPYAKAYDIPVILGSESDVLDRFVRVYQQYPADNIIRICADNPFIAPEELDRLIEFFIGSGFDYAFNHIPKLNNHYPDGLGAEIMLDKVLMHLNDCTILPADREHLTRYLWTNAADFRMGVLQAPTDIAYPTIKLDIDTPEDLSKLEKIASHLSFKSSAKTIIDAVHSGEAHL